MHQGRPIHRVDIKYSSFTCCFYLFIWSSFNNLTYRKGLHLNAILGKNKIKDRSYCLVLLKQAESTLFKYGSFSRIKFIIAIQNPQNTQPLYKKEKD